MNIRTLIASTIVFGALATGASADSGGFYCGKDSTYDRETLTCVDNFGGKVVNENAGISVPSAGAVVDNSEIGDFINESATDRNQRSAR
jgi:hypothetical protein